MRDLTLDDIASKVRDKLIEELGASEITPAMCRFMTREYLEYIEMIITKEKGRFSLWQNSDVTHIVKPLDHKKLCEEFAAEPDGCITYDSLLKKRRLSRAAAGYMKRQSFFEMRAKAKLELNEK